MRLWLFAVLGGVMLAHGALAAPPIDCARPLARAGKTIDRVAGDLQGMGKTLAKSEKREIHRLLAKAKRLHKAARGDCKPSATAFDRAKAIAKATGARGYAKAADLLHAHYLGEPFGGAIKGRNKPAP